MAIARSVNSKFSLTAQFFRYSHVLRPLRGLKRKKSAGEQWGFTLIELLVVSALIGGLAVMSATVLSSILRSQNKTTIINEVRQNGNIVIDKFERDVKQSRSILGTANSVTLETYSSRYIVWNCSGGNFTRGEGNTSAAAVTNAVGVINSDSVNGVRVASCQFTVTGSSGTRIPQIVQLTFTLAQGTSAPSRSEFESSVPFETTAATRAY